jgi:hypothetical protein
MPGTSSTLISPVPLVPGRGTPVAVSVALTRLENAFVGTIAKLSNEERLAYWRVVSDYVAANLANVEGKLAYVSNAAESGTPASAGG